MLLLAFSNAAYADPEEYISPEEYTAAKIADMKGSSGNLQSQLGLGAVYADNSAGVQDLTEAAKWYEKAFFGGSLEQIIGQRGDRVNSMQMWWHITTYTQILQNKPDAESAFKLAYMAALLAANDENGADYYAALKQANIAQSYAKKPAYVSSTNKLIKLLVRRIKQEEIARKRSLHRN